MALDWIANLFQSEQTRGLSGGQAAALALDESNPYYNFRLRRHTCDGDLVADPSLIWYTSPLVKRRAGLGTHVASEMSAGVAGFVDALIVLSAADFDRAEDTEMPWLETLPGLLRDQFDQMCQRERLSRRFPKRRLGFRVLCDGGPEMGGHRFDLQPGTFITGLLPNLYTGPVETSRALVTVHASLPGAWTGWREVARLYDDQIVATLGAHWLDNFQHPRLREAALYRLQRGPDGRFVHVVSPDLQDRYQLVTRTQGTVTTSTLATRQGDVLAHIVLELADEPLETGAAPSISPPMLSGPRTLQPDSPRNRVVSLQERGALLQRVHFGAFMEGYDVYLGTRGELGTAVDEKAATFEVRKKGVQLVAHVPGVEVGGQSIPPGSSVALEGDTVVLAASERFEYRDLRGISAEGWPYVGEIRRPASATYLAWGEEHKVGRARECRVTLPDEPRNDNIRWKKSVGDGSTIRARSGNIPKSRFYIDSIMVASEHAALDLRGDVPRLVTTARQCFCYVRRGDEVTALHPAEVEVGPHAAPLNPGDEVLIGNCLFQIGFPPRDAAVPPASAPMFTVQSDETPPPAPVAAPPQPVAPAKPVTAPPPPAWDAPDADDQTDPRGLPTVPRPAVTAWDDEEDEDDATVAPPPRPAAPAPPPPPAEPTLPPPPSRTAEASWIGDEEDDDPNDLFGPPPVVATVGPPSAAPTWPLPPAPPSEAPAPERMLSPQTSNTLDPPGAPGIGLGGGAAPRVAAPPPPALFSRPEPTTAEPTLAPVRPPPPAFDAPPRPAPPPVVPPAPVAPPPPVAAPPPAPEAPPPPAPVAAPPAPVAPPPAPVAAPPAPVAPPPAPVAPVVAATPAPAAPRAAVGEVVAVDDEDAQFELGRRVQIVQVGWMVAGTLVLGNHTGADLVLPENRVVPDQSFTARSYVSFSVRGRRASLVVLDGSEVRIDGEEAALGERTDIENMPIEIVRRDERGDEDFLVVMQLVEDRRLPNPRARLLQLDHEDDLAAALLTRGLPTRAPRTLTLDGVRVTLLNDGSKVELTDYLETYRTEAGYRPFFVSQNEGRYVAAPEDGTPLVLSPGDRFVIGSSVYTVRVQ
jgi:hypothetical protein